MAMVPSVPATKEPMAAVARAAAPRPLLRHHISLDRGDDRAGFARRVEQDRGGRAAIHGAVIEAGEHDEGAGRIELGVIGSSSAMVSAGPMPGRMPIAVPSVMPSRHHMRLIGVIAVAKPSSREERTSMAQSNPREYAGRQLQAEPVGEAEIG